MGKDSKKSKIANNQSGMAAILISLIMMLVISLIVLGFTQITRHEQQAALTKILSTQALYAAESGVNDAQNIIAADIQSGNIPAKTSCATPDANYNFNPELDPTAGIQYTCLLVNPAPTSLFYSPVTTDQSKIIVVQSKSTFYQLMISWENTDSTGFSCTVTYPKFPPNSRSDWKCSAGVLRVEIVPINTPSDETVIFLYPTAGVLNGYGTADYTGANGSVYKGSCYSPNTAKSMPEWCNAEIKNLNSSLAGGYYLRVKAIYGNQDVSVMAPPLSTDVTCLPGPSCTYDELINDQVIVDSTGQAQNVLKRIQARVPDNPFDSSHEPDAAIQSSNSICKQFFVTDSHNNDVYDNLTTTNPDDDVAPNNCSLN
jgi:Tfp pilus assembly protein PilX